MKLRKKTNQIIFHHSLSDFGDVRAFREWHLQRGFDDIGYHYVIGRLGQIEAGRPIEYIGAHAFGKNSDSIGVCLVGDFRRYEPSIAQLTAAQEVYHMMCNRYNTPLRIGFHRDAWTFNACPGKRLDRVDFLEIVTRSQTLTDKTNMLCGKLREEK